MYFRILVYFLLWINLFTNLAYAGQSDKYPLLRSFGDYMQVINPIGVAIYASQTTGVGHFARIYAQSWVSTHGIKYFSKKTQWNMSKRPQKALYDGMPSGHTNSAWIAAAYTRHYISECRYCSVPLYISSALTGYSRIHAKQHTVAQVIFGALLAELVVYINSNLDWNKNYNYSSIEIMNDSMKFSFYIRL